MKSKITFTALALIAIAGIAHGQGLNTFDGVDYKLLIAPQTATNAVVVTGTAIDRTTYHGKATFVVYAGSTGAGAGGYVKLQHANAATGTFADVSGLVAIPATNNQFHTFQFIQQDLRPFIRAVATTTNSAADPVGTFAAWIATPKIQH